MYNASADGIAVVGLSCKLPGADSLDKYWQLLINGRSAVNQPNATSAGGRYVFPKTAGYLNGIDGFDADFFGIRPAEAATIDPRQLLMLELCWEAIEDAGISPDALKRRSVGVFVGASRDEFGESIRVGDSDAYAAAGTHRAMIANRVSRFFDFTGPSMVLDSAQSSSLIAVHLACESIRRGESSVAIAGGVSLMVTGSNVQMMDNLGVISRQGECRAFDANADGFVPGEGGGIVLLKPLAQALRDGDRIYSVILGGAINQDGASTDFMAPSVAAQEELFLSALRRANVGSDQVRYVELHGTGTVAGDLAEAAALVSVFGKRRGSDGSWLQVGSVKTNIGHLDAAAGIAGFIKVALGLLHETIPPSLNYATPNGSISAIDSGVAVLRQGLDLSADDGRAVAGVSSFGMGGTNCHIVVAAHSARANNSDTSQAFGLVQESATTHGLVWVLSGRSGEGLLAQGRRLQEWLLTRPELDPVDVGWSLISTR
ncbi:beta-ketoacyl synthase N-terminal-like domain-containing protein, partial [Nocardia noduli]|uniref:beta-ketoacyl synthase N-terminal-like domain-containing protein n=1 Tax=Nocardia noduli TaxID=2815722 RepID=UPI001C23B792